MNAIKDFRRYSLDQKALSLDYLTIESSSEWALRNKVDLTDFVQVLVSAETPVHPTIDHSARYDLWSRRPKGTVAITEYKIVSNEVGVLNKTVGTALVQKKRDISPDDPYRFRRFMEYF